MSLWKVVSALMLQHPLEISKPYQTPITRRVFCVEVIDDVFRVITAHFSIEMFDFE